MHFVDEIYTTHELSEPHFDSRKLKITFLPKKKACCCYKSHVVVVVNVVAALVVVVNSRGLNLHDFQNVNIIFISQIITFHITNHNKDASSCR